MLMVVHVYWGKSQGTTRPLHVTKLLDKLLIYFLNWYFYSRNLLYAGIPSHILVHVIIYKDKE